MNVLLIRQTNKRKEWGLAFCFALLFWSVLAWATHLFDGGFLLWDDVILADLHAALKHTDPFTLYGQLVQKDLHIRLRPLALMHYLVMARVYGLNYAALLAHNLVIASMACAFLYSAARNMGASKSVAILFVAVTCFGNQGVFALRLVLAENPGMLFTAICAWFLSTGNRWPALMAFTLAALTKESFVLLAPAVVLTDMLLTKSISFRTYWQNQSRFVSALLLITAIVLAIIVFRVGTHSIHYAGIDQDTFSPGKLMRALFMVLLAKGYGLALVPLALGLWFAGREPGNSAFRSSAWTGVALIVALAIPQTILYAKSGIFMHYLLPAELWSGALVVMCWNNPMSIPKNFQWAFQSVMRVLLLFNSTLMVNNAMDIARWGRDAQLALNAVTSKSQAKDSLLIIGHPVRDYEKATDAAHYLASDMYQRPNVSILPTVGTDSTGSEQDRRLTGRFIEANRTFIARRTELLQHSAVILFMPGAMQELLQHDSTGLNLARLDTTRVGSFLVATRSHP